VFLESSARCPARIRSVAIGSPDPPLGSHNVFPYTNFIVPQERSQDYEVFRLKKVQHLEEGLPPALREGVREHGKGQPAAL